MGNHNGVVENQEGENTILQSSFNWGLVGAQAVMEALAQDEVVQLTKLQGA